MTMSENMMLVRCPKCGFGNRVKDDTVQTMCLKCGENIRVTEVKTIGA